ncbi:Lipase 1 [Geobacteraceae bacterium]|nr:Lipase 1 [Geobacteraceae bacterium]
MNRNNSQNHGIARGCRSLEATLVVKALIGGLLGVAVLPPVAGYSQTLDEAVTNQLKPDNTRFCVELLGGDPSSVLFGPLRGICEELPANGPSNSTGGGAASPATLPKIVQQRLREMRGEKTSPPKVQASSGDAVARFESGLSLFLSGEYESLDRDVTTFEDGYDSDIWRVTAGADYQFTDRAAAGLAFGYSQHDGDFTGGGRFENDSYDFLAFGSFLPFKQTFVQVTAGYARKQYDRDRIATFTQFAADGTRVYNFSGSENADYDADEVRVGALAGYDFPVGNVTISPHAGLDWAHIDFDTYSETGASGLELTYYDDERDSFQSTVGVQAQVGFQTGFGVLVPQASVDWMHEFENNQRTVDVSFVGDTRAKQFTYKTASPDRDWLEINAGVVAVLPNDLQVFANYRTLVGHSYYDSHTATVGLRMSF